MTRLQALSIISTPKHEIHSRDRRLCRNTQSREQAETVMQTKLFAGDAADIYYFRNDMLSPLPWISAGLLYDLDPLIASDSEISEEDIIPWTAMHEYGGLYLLSPTFGVVALSLLTADPETSYWLDDYGVSGYRKVPAAGAGYDLLYGSGKFSEKNRWAIFAWCD